MGQAGQLDGEVMCFNLFAKFVSLLHLFSKPSGTDIVTRFPLSVRLLFFLFQTYTNDIF